MTVCDNRTLKRRAGESLSRSQTDHRRILLIHTGITLLASALLLVLDYLLSAGIEKRPGLAGMDRRTMLQTAQQALLILNFVVAPFWEQGLRYWSMQASREQYTDAQTLTGGFLRFRPLLRLIFARAVVLFALSFACSYIASMIYAMTPGAEPMMDALWEAMENPEAMLDMESIMSTLPEEVANAAATSMMIILGVLLAITYLPVLYLFRLADFYMLDKPELRAWKALKLSARSVFRDFWRLLKLDLSFWWYYLLTVVLMVAANLDVLLPGMGISLPVSQEVAYFGSFLIYALGTLALRVAAGGKLAVCYARAYDFMKI